MKLFTCNECGGQLADLEVLPIHCACGSVNRDPSCLVEVSELPKTLQPVPPDRIRHVDSKLTRWAIAVVTWINAGRPRRTEVDALLIIETQCRPCEFFKGGICTHSKCGCSLAGKGYWISRVAVRVAKSFGVEPVMFQKTRMATEHCPIRKW